MDNSKINQTELSYSCGAGDARVNLYTGRLALEYQLASIGLKTYGLSLSLVYNSHFEIPNKFSTNLGNKWKLNIQQYLYYENDRYYYVDASGVRIEFEHLITDTYFDTLGLGLKLTKNSNQCIIRDTLDNEMIFENEKLVKTISTENINISKVYEYEKNNIIKMYDERKPDNKFTFEYYENNLIKAINVYIKNKLKFKYKFNYVDNNLVSIYKEQNDYEKVYLLYNYQNNLLKYAVYVENRSAFKFNYSEDKIINVITGVASLESDSNMKIKFNVGDDIYVGENIYPNDLIAKEQYKIIECMDTLGEDILKSNTIEYYNNYRVVTNEMNLKFVYYLNKKGYTTSVLEANGSTNYMNDLRTLERMPGIRLLNQNECNSDECINKQKSLEIATSTVLVFDNDIRKDEFSNLQLYRQDCKFYINYVCSFWLKTLDEILNNKINLFIKTSQKIETAIFYFDETAVNSWQEVRIPIQINDDKIEGVILEFEEKDQTKHIKIADMKFYDCGTNKLMIGDSFTQYSISDVTEVIYNQTSIIGQEKTLFLGSNNYITEKDLQMTYFYRFKNTANNEGNVDYPFFYNDCTKFILVRFASLKVNEENIFHINMIQDEIEGQTLYARPNYFLKSYSPDGDVITNQITYFLNSYDIDDQKYNCMLQKTEVNLYEGGSAHKQSYILNCTDVKGKILLEQDEYGVQTIYKYNEYGEMIKKIITSKNGTERIEENITFKDDVETIDNGKVRINNYYDDNENITKSDYLGVNESDDTILYNEFTYDYFNEKIKSITNNLNANNQIKYDSYGRICEVSPKKIDDDNYYGYKFRYDVFGDPKNFLFLYKDKSNNKIVEDILLTRSEQRKKDESVVYTNLHLENNSFVNIENHIDNYGRNTKIINDKNVVTFVYDSLDESYGAANIIQMNDNEDEQDSEEHLKKHYYNYNEDNNLIEYGYTNTDSEDYLKIVKTEENLINFKFNTWNKYINDHEIEVEINKDTDKLLSPRIISDSTHLKRQNISNCIKYDYDELNRLISKRMNLNYNWNVHTSLNSKKTITNVNKTIKYIEGKNLVENIISKSSYFIDQNVEKDNYLFNCVCGYNERFDLTNSFILFEDDKGKTEHYITTYEYNPSSQLKKETFNYQDNSNSSNNKINTIEYTYNNDGSIDSINENGTTKKYLYENGRLSKIKENNSQFSLTYDNLGNTLTYGEITYTYKRGSLLSSFNNGTITTNYYYNGQGKKYKKVLSNGTTFNYVYDGDKLISERIDSTDTNNLIYELIYLYDMTGIYGFTLTYGDYSENYGNCYYFEKDVLGNVVALTNGFKRVAKYTYDAFGNCTVTNYTDIDELNVGDINPIRWKGMYCEVESNLYFLKNNTYSPELRQTLSMNYLDEIVNNSFSLYNLYAYNVFSINPVILSYDDFTASSSLALTYKEKGKTKWQRLWDRIWSRWWGKVIAVGITALALVLTWYIAPCTLPSFAFALGSVGATLVVGGIMAGIISANHGKGFWNAFINYINDNWAQTLAIEMAMYLVSFGVTQALGIGTKCFIEGTLILTSIGLVKIEDIKVGDKVWSYNEETKEKELKTVKRLFRNKTKEWLHIILQIDEKEEEIICTPNHRIYIKGKGWIKANEILENNEVLLYNNTVGKVIKKELQILEQEEATYNFEVEDNHNYYVSEESILVHNDCLDNNEIKSFNVLEFDATAIAMAKEGNPTFQTFKRRLFKYQNELTPGLFDDLEKGLNPKINGQKVILHHPKGRVGPNLYNVVGVTQAQHLEIHGIIGYRNPKWELVSYNLGKGVF